MSDEIQTLLTLRKVTRALAEHLRGQMTEHLATLTPLLRPRAVFGDYVQGGAKEGAKRADKAFKELQSLWESLVSAKPFTGLPRELNPPLDVLGHTLEITPVDYAHSAANDHETKAVTVRSPLKWVLTYTGFAPARLGELIALRSRNTEDLQKAVLNYLTLHIVLSNQPGVGRILDALHFPLTFEKHDAFGVLPVVTISAGISTRRPADSVIFQSAELTGMDAFEEVVVVDDITRLSDQGRERMLEIVRAQGPSLLQGQ
jgi:hypothetical protein